jgi:hypothetical protein
MADHGVVVHHRVIRRTGVVVAVALQLTVPASARSQAAPAELRPLDRTFALQERGCGDPSTAEPSCSALAEELGRRPGWRVVGFEQVTATLPSGLRSDCDVHRDDVGWPTIWIRCFDEADTGQHDWLTQGIGGSDEGRTAETPGGGRHFLVATWCWRGSGIFAEFDVCHPGQPVKRTRISLIDVDRNGYRNVELVEPYRAPQNGRPPVVGSRGVLLHAGGAAIAGRWLYVADTDWLYVFNLNHFVQDGHGPYQLPVWRRYVIADARDRDEHNLFSSISIDGSGATPRLVAAEYRFGSRDDALVTAWPLGPDGQLGPGNPVDRLVRSSRAYTIDGRSGIDRVQGVAAAGDVFLFSASSDRIERAAVGRARRPADRCIRWGKGNGEALYASRSRDLLVGINEGFLANGSAFWAVSYRLAFGLGPEPAGFPRRDC